VFVEAKVAKLNDNYPNQTITIYTYAYEDVQNFEYVSNQASVDAVDVDPNNPEIAYYATDFDRIEITNDSLEKSSQQSSLSLYNIKKRYINALDEYLSNPPVDSNRHEISMVQAWRDQLADVCNQKNFLVLIRRIKFDIQDNPPPSSFLNVILRDLELHYKQRNRFDLPHSKKENDPVWSREVSVDELLSRYNKKNRYQKPGQFGARPSYVIDKRLKIMMEQADILHLHLHEVSSHQEPAQSTSKTNTGKEKDSSDDTLVEDGRAYLAQHFNISRELMKELESALLNKEPKLNYSSHRKLQADVYRVLTTPHFAREDKAIELNIILPYLREKPRPSGRGWIAQALKALKFLGCFVAEYIV